MQTITSKNRTPGSIRYNAWMALRFPTVPVNAGSVSTTVQARLPLLLNCKIIGVSTVVSGGSTGVSSFNVSIGPGVYEAAAVPANPGSPATPATTAGQTVSFQAGNGASAGTLALVFNNHNTQVTIANGSQNAAVQSAIVSAINGDAGAFVFATAGNVSTGTINFTARVAGANANSYGFNLTAGSTNITINPPQGNLSGGADAVPAVPATPAIPALTPKLAPNDQTNVGVYPTPVAAPGNAVFAVDQSLSRIDETVQQFYTPNFDAVYGPANELTLRVTSDGNGAGNLDVILWVVPVDINFASPENRAQAFVPGPATL